MKRYLTLFFVVMFAFVLAACDQLPSQVTDLSEELCRDNPDNELCDIENLTDIEEDVVRDLVLDALEHIQTGNASACDEVFAITNVDLLDDCKAAAASIFPSDVESFVFVEAMKEGNSYVVTGDIGNDELLVITVSVGEVEGQLRITDWSIERIDNSDPVVELLDEEFIKNMLGAYTDDTVANDAFNEMYFGDMLEADFFEEREDDQMDNLEFNVLSVTLKEGNLYEVEMEISTDEGMDTTTILIEVVGEGDNRYLVLHDEEEPNPCDTTVCEETELSLDDAKMVFKMFLDALYDATVTNEELGAMYFGGELPLEMERDPVDLENMNFETEIVDADYGYKMNEFTFVVNFMMDGNNFTEEITVMLYQLDDGYLIVIDDLDNDCDGIDDDCDGYIDDDEEVYYIIDEYFMLYADSSVSNEEFAAMFFGGEVSEEFKLMRTQDLANQVTFELLNVSYSYDSFFDIEYYEYRGDDPILRKRPGRIRYTESSYVIEWDELKEEDFFTVEEEVYEVFMNFVADYFDASLTDDELLEMYFGGDRNNDFLYSRQEELETGFQVVLLGIERIDDITFSVLLEFTEGDEVYDGNLKIRVKRIDAATPLLIILDGEDNDCDGVDEDCDYEEVVFDPAEVEMKLNMFLANYLDPDDDGDVINTYFWAEVPEFLFNRDLYLAEGTMIEVSMIEPNYDYGDGYFDITFTLRNGENAEDVTVKAVMTITYGTQFGFIVNNHFDPNTCVLTTSVCHLLTDPTMGSTYFTMFLDLFNDKTIPTDELWMYVYGSSYLLDERYNGEHENLTWTLLDGFDYTDDGWFYFMIEAVDGETVIHRDIAVRIYETDFGFLIQTEDFYDYCYEYPEDCYYEPVVKDMDYAANIFDMFLQDYIDTTYTFEDLNYMYFDGMAPYFLESHRDQLLTENTEATLTSISYNGVDSFFDISYVMSTPNLVQEHMVTVRIYDFEGYYYIEFFDETNECHVDPASCEPYNMYETDLSLIEPFVMDLFDALNDSTMTMELIDEMYFGWMAPEMLLEQRYNGGAVFVYQGIYPSQYYTNGTYFDIVYSISYDNGDVLDYEFTASFYKMDQGLVIEPTYVDEYEDTIVDELIEVAHYVFEYAGTDIPVADELCVIFDDVSNVLCYNIFEYHSINMYYSYVDIFEVIDDYTVYAYVLTFDMDGTLVEETTFVFGLDLETFYPYVEALDSTNPYYTVTPE